MKKPYSAKERGILITYWAGEVWKTLNGERYNQLRKSYWTATGCFITSDESDDSLIQPEGLESY